MTASAKEHIRVALAGNPNCGKTTIFNILTNANAHVGNYPGVTVERRVGHFELDKYKVELIDLPGVYGLSSSSPEEMVAADELLNNRPDFILNVLDSSNLQRNLYLTMQLAELNLPMLLVFNMIDDAKKRGFEFDYDKINKYFGVTTVETIGSANYGIDKLKAELARRLDAPSLLPNPIRYGGGTDEAISRLTDKISTLSPLPFDGIMPRYFAVKLLEDDPQIVKFEMFKSLSSEIESARQFIMTRHGVNGETFMADCRYGVIAGVCREAVKMNQIRRQYISDQIDKFLTNRFLGLPLFLLIMLAVFAFTFFCAQPLTGLLENLFSGLANLIGAHWPEDKLTFIRDLICDGIIGGVGGVLSFLPNILFLFLAIAFLEGTGYMARAAFIMDGCMHKFGLHGKSFIPMLLGFGCTVPAVMATRTIESKRDRLTTIMILPLMSCGARLPIYSLIIPAFFRESLQAAVLWIIYIIGVLLALLAARLLKSTLFNGDDEVFVMELPPYRMPTLRSLLIHGWERTVMYLHKAGTLILGASIILFIINTYPKKTELSKDYQQLIAEVNASGRSEELKANEVAELKAEAGSEMLSYTIAGRIGNTLSVAMAPLGFDWRSSSALIGAFAAKELFVAQLGIVFAVGDTDDEAGQNKLTDSIRQAYTPLQGFCMMLFCLISMPCVATVAVVRRETESWVLTLGQLFGLTLAAYIITLIVYQAGLFLGL